MTPFELALKHTLGIEAGYVNDARDSGGATNYGITEAKARAWGYTGDMKDLPLDLAVRIYKADFWDIIHLDKVAEVAPEVAYEMFDTAVNCGPSVPVKFLQRMLNLFNNGGTAYPDVEIDGMMGKNTESALRAFVQARGRLGVEVLVEALNCMQGTFYTELAERRPKDEAFAFGWFANRIVKRLSA